MSSVAVPRVTVQRGIFRGPDHSTWPGARVDIKSGPGGFAFRWFRSTLRWSGADSPKDAEYERMRTAHRASANLRDRILTGGLRVMFTFTHRANVEDLQVSRACMRRFLRRMRDRYPKFKWAGAAERQKRGAWHWHLAVNGFYDINVVRRCWELATGDLFGNVNVHAFDSSARAGQYLAKYLSKTFLEESERVRYGHHYMVARGLRPDVHKYLLLGTSHQDLIAFVEEEARAMGFASRSWCSDAGPKWSGRGWGDG